MSRTLQLKHKIIDGREVVKATATGEFDFEATKEALKRMLEEPEASQYEDILFDFRKAECELTIAEIFEVVQFMVELQWSPLRRIALVVLEGIEFDRAKFMELCAANRGLQIQAFVDPSEAKAWLRLEE